jgi:CRISPR-associated protein Cmr2
LLERKTKPVTQIYWQAKIWGLLHDPALKALHHNSGRGGNSFWRNLAVMKDWVEESQDPEQSVAKALKQIHLADLIASASDRGAIGSLSTSINYGSSETPQRGLDIFHLLSGARLHLRLSQSQHQALLNSQRAAYLTQIEQGLFQQQIQDPIDGQLKSIEQIEDAKKVFWWLWRCLPTAVCNAFSDGTQPDESLLLMPAETRIPDGSIWSHTSLTSALAGSLTGFNVTSDDLKRWPSGKKPSRAYLATFSFTPIQELIKASRKMRDFWAGSWILHYLSAKVCWALAWKYGPDSLVYPSLFQQPLIDYWLLEKWPDLKPWVNMPSDRQLLTAGFPNVIVMVLPEDKVQAAMQMAEQTLRDEWLKLGHLVFEELHEHRRWMPQMDEDHKTWKGWLNSQWQTYWSALPIGDQDQNLTSNEIYKVSNTENQSWRLAQNKTYRLTEDQALFTEKESDFLQEAANFRWQRYKKHPFKANVGSWWPYVFDQTRLALTSVKSARTWEIATAFGVRSTVSGLGPVVHPESDWIAEGRVTRLWQRHAGLFDGREQLNATETLKRGLHKILPKLFSALDENTIDASYPDLTAGVAGYLKVSNREHLAYFHKVCRNIRTALVQQADGKPSVPDRWGIPWIDEHSDPSFHKFHCRYANAGWLAEEIPTDQTKGLERQILKEADEQLIDAYEQELTLCRKEYRDIIQKTLDRDYSGNNPADWYVLAAGDGDGMNEWLKGNKLETYRHYVPSTLKVQDELRESFESFLDEKKRMGPATHGALSRALLDFSNQLVPYLTEQRYAGRLIYGGGDDVLAYSNLWEWDKWLWDIRECFRGQPDPQGEFDDEGDYWRWQKGAPPKQVSARPLFTMGGKATISFGISLAHHSVPLAIALENLWEAEAESKKHISADGSKKNAVQVRVLYGNGNILKATAKFEVFNEWRSLLTLNPTPDPALFEQAAQVWEQHPVPVPEAIGVWANAFCDRRDVFSNKPEAKQLFHDQLTQFLNSLWVSTEDDVKVRNAEVNNWLKLAAFVLRKREIKIGGVQ